MVTEQVRRHLTTYLGKPVREAAFRTASDEIEVLKWDLRKGPLGVILYGTVGASRLTAPGTSHRLEFHLGLQEARDDVASALAELAIEPIRDGQPFAVGHTLTLPGPLWQGTSMSTFMMWTNRLKMVPALTLADGTHLEMLSVLAIYPEELVAKQRAGAIGLMQHFKAHQVAHTDPDRRPVAGLASVRA
jgi:hypothetical protein